MAVSHKWVSYVQRCLSPWQMLTIHIKYKWGNNLLDITFKNHCFFGPLSFHSLDPCMFKNTFTWIYIYLGFMLHACLKTLVTWVLYSHFTFTLQSQFIRISCSCVFRNICYMNGFSQDIHIFSIYIVLMATLLFRFIHTTQATQVETQITWKLIPTKSYSGEGPPCH